MVLIAEASAFANNEQFGEYEHTLLNSALKIDPKHERALWYAGYAAYKNANFADAAKHWDVLLELVPQDRTDVKNTLLNFPQRCAPKIRTSNHCRGCAWPDGE